MTPFKIIKWRGAHLFNPSGWCRSSAELFHPQIYWDLSHFSRDLKGTAELNLQIICSMPKPLTKVTNYLCFLCYLSLSAAYEVIQHVLLSFAISLRLFHCPSMHQCQPPSPQAPDLWIVSWSVITVSSRRHWCWIHHRENRLMSPNIMNIILTTCGHQHPRFIWNTGR